MRLIASPDQEFLHPPSDHADFGESYYFNAFDTTLGVSVALRIGLKPNQRKADYFLCVFFPDGSTGFVRRYVPWTSPADLSLLPNLDLGDLNIRCEEPNQRWAIDFDGDVHLYNESPTEQDKFRVLDAISPTVTRIKLSGLFTGMNQVVDFESVRTKALRPGADLLRSFFATLNPKSLKHLGLTVTSIKTMMQGGHTEQPMRFEGKFQVLDHVAAFADETAFSGVGHRDHSWGVRDGRCLRNWKWFSWVFDEHFALNVTQVELLGMRVSAAVIWDGTNVQRAEEIEIHSNYGKHTYWPESVTMQITPESGDTFNVNATVESALPVVEDAKSTRFIVTPCLSNFESAGRQSQGIVEYMEHTPWKL